jgi:environmental stress-induced protein Ves
MIIRRKEELTTSRWSGGTTTELFIHPAGSSYASRDFDVRISTATVELETSEFTLLPGYSRILVVLEGSLRLHFETDKPFDVELEELEQITFPGHYQTTGYGKVRDFNAMTSAGYSASAELHRLAAGNVFELEPGLALEIIFVLTGMVGAGTQECAAGDVILTEDETVVKLTGSEDTVLLVARVWKVEEEL